MEDINNFAPVLIPTLNRYIHFKRCVESLSRCTYAQKTDLYIALDYPLNDSHWDGYSQICHYINKIKGFKNIVIIKREKNFGVKQNLFDARKSIFEKYDRYILSEDDNVFAPSFLKFVNKGLDVYENRDDIFAVTGYNSPIPMPYWYKYDAYLRTDYTAWGVGIWKKKWEKVDWTLEDFNAMLANKANYRILQKYYRRALPQLLKIKKTGIITGDSFLLLYLLDKNMYSVYPTKSRVRNTGHDGTGIHCSNNDTKYMNQEIYEGVGYTNHHSDLVEDKKISKFIFRQNRLTSREIIRSYIPYNVRVIVKKYLDKIFGHCKTESK